MYFVLIHKCKLLLQTYKVIALTSFCNILTFPVILRVQKSSDAPGQANNHLGNPLWTLAVKVTHRGVGCYLGFNALSTIEPPRGSIK